MINPRLEAFSDGVLAMFITIMVLQLKVPHGTDLAGMDSLLSRALGTDLKGKLSPVIYRIAIGAAFWKKWAAGMLYAMVALMWLVPDRRIERALAAEGGEG